MSMRDMCVAAIREALVDQAGSQSVALSRVFGGHVNMACTAALDAILAVMAEPTPEMVEAGMAACYDQAPETIGIYTAMLKAIR